MKTCVECHCPMEKKNSKMEKLLKTCGTFIHGKVYKPWIALLWLCQNYRRIIFLRAESQIIVTTHFHEMRSSRFEQPEKFSRVHDLHQLSQNDL